MIGNAAPGLTPKETPPLRQWDGKHGTPDMDALPNGVEVAALVTMQPTAAKEDGRVCNKCSRWKQRDAFYQAADYRGGMMARCKQCCSDIAKARYRARPEESRAKTREQTRRWYHSDKRRARSTSLRHEYGITIEQFEAMSIAQDHKCAICGAGCPTGMRLSVDHCHETDKIRGLLCKPCNMALGLFRDDPAKLQRAIEYLQRTGTAKTS